MNLGTVVSVLIALFWGQRLLVLLIVFPLIPIAIPILVWLMYEELREKKHQEMAIAANAINPGAYCDECFRRLAGNTAEHPHTYGCSHSKELHFVGTKR